ncbi:MAG: 5-oxoprolinase/urea amidolyase family protein [Candidatus Nanopelagicales bacterium]
MTHPAPPITAWHPMGEDAVLLEFADPELRWSVASPLARELVVGARTVLVRYDPTRHAAGAVVESVQVGGQTGRVPREHLIDVVYDGPDLPDVAQRAGLSAPEVVRRHTTTVYTCEFCGFAPGFAYLSDWTPRWSGLGATVPVRGFRPAPWRSPARSPRRTPHRPRRLATAGDHLGRPVPGRPRPPCADPSRRPRAFPGGPVIIVRHPGPLTTVQDRGRPGWSSVGVTPSGAYDRAAAHRANRLVGNSESHAVLEAVGGGLDLEFVDASVIAVTGATGSVAVDGVAAARNATVIVRAGARLTLGPLTRGLRSYLAVRGGIAVAPVMGSRSWDSLGRVGPPPLAVGDALPVGPGRGALPPLDHVPVVADDGALTMAPGPRLDWFAADSWRLLTSTEYLVSPDSDRIGVRLTGPALTRVAHRRTAELPPEGMVRGAIQVPPDGLPILLGPDHPTTGGYPVVGVLSGASSDRCAQLLPGDRVRLSAILDPGR